MEGEIRLTKSPQGRKPAAILAELEENLADLKAKAIRREISADAYLKAAAPLAKRIRKLAQEIGPLEAV